MSRTSTGNWSDFDQDDDGDDTWDLEQTRDHDEANEIEEIDEATTHVAHDAAGNMTKVPMPDDWSDDYTLTYDAWNRLVKVQDGETTVAEYEYDGRNRRTVKTVSGTARHFYYSGGWRVVEERVGASTNAVCQYSRPAVEKPASPLWRMRTGWEANCPARMTGVLPRAAGRRGSPGYSVRFFHEKGDSGG